MRRLLLISVSIYKRIFSPVLYGLGIRCRFHPTCSDYAVAAIKAHSPLHACRLIVARLLKCGPWHCGGVDFVDRRLSTVDSNR